MAVVEDIAGDGILHGVAGEDKVIEGVDSGEDLVVAANLSFYPHPGVDGEVALEEAGNEAGELVSFDFGKEAECPFVDTDDGDVAVFDEVCCPEKGAVTTDAAEDVHLGQEVLEGEDLGAGYRGDFSLGDKALGPMAGKEAKGLFCQVANVFPKKATVKTDMGEIHDQRPPKNLFDKRGLGKIR